ncbi:TPM domain-containing protein [Neobacillus notoginsengisoli]|uniref:TPM domain-containing protein n=1 Tax=Neobacillus notoginsengisoli TaxID=1578198 RepID=A0A417YRZ0_9BACI|nr:TPM domain-containing protein [Neobacillus notoginsengisoli]RHW38049.1 TPM domain-containing protein [Neobacillus notoginsengisoli]
MKLLKASSIFALLVLFLLGGSAGAFAADDKIPAPRGDIYVQDFADVLSPVEEQQLIGWGRQIEDRANGAQVAVLTVNSMGGRDIQGYANEAFRKFKLGSAKEDNGVLIVLAMGERKIWIEVGYGLEGIIPDGKAGRILDTHAVPALKAGNPNQAVMKTYQALGNEIAGDGISGETNPSGAAESEQSGGLPDWLVIILVVGFLFIDFVFFRGTFTFLLLSMIGRGGGGGGGGGGGPRGGGGGSSGGGGAGRGW